jgi:hypothetical protein
MVGLLMNDKLERIWQEEALAWLRYYSAVYLEGLMKYTQPVSGHSLEPSTSEYKSKALELVQLAPS